jgi:N-acetylneuraminic acid mutarotase
VKKSDFTGLKRERSVAFSINDVGYVGTGIDTAEIVKTDFWSYDDVTDSWTQIADIPGSERRNAMSFTVGNYGYVTGGLNTPNATDAGATILNDTWRYDPLTNSWTAMASFPGNNGNGMYFGAAFSIDDYGYVVGGKHGPNNYTDNMYRYDPMTDSWSTMADFPAGVRYQLAALSVTDKGYVGFGTDQDLYRQDWWEYKPSNDTWAERASLPASVRASSVTFTLGERGYICMGTNGGVLGDLWEYDPFANTWTSRAPYGGSARKNAIAFTLGSRAYVGTGKGISGKKQSMHEYHPMQSLGMDEENLEISVYPNPASHFVKIKSEITPDKVELYNMQGQMVLSEENTNELSLIDLPAGSYRLVAKQGNQYANSSIIIQ